MPEPKSISFRAPLQGEVQDVLSQIGIECVQTTTALVDLIVELGRYEEEGAQLFPQVLLCTDLTQALGVLQGEEPLLIGTGRRGPDTGRMALKKCAPLARGAWTVYLELADACFFRYGVFRTSLAPTALGLRETLSSLPDDHVGMALISQVAERVVELACPSNRRLLVHLSAAKSDDPEPGLSLDALVEAATAEAEAKVREPLRTYLRTNLSRALIEGHGALLAVAPQSPLPAGRPSLSATAADRSLQSCS